MRASPVEVAIAAAAESQYVSELVPLLLSVISLMILVIVFLVCILS